MCKRILPLLFATLCVAQIAPQSRNALTNHDIVVLARAGFSEEFIVEAIAGARTQFDTSADALAALAHEGITEKVIRAMMPPPPPPAKPVEPPATRPAEPPEAKPAEPYTDQPTSADEEHPKQAKPVKPAKPAKPPKPVRPSGVELAMANHTPYYESSSLLFGLAKKEVAVGTPSGDDRKVAAQLGAIYQQVKVQHQ
jgi:outer membrane biosynthesis protein TonB